MCIWVVPAFETHLGANNSSWGGVMLLKVLAVAPNVQ